jgi:hypothetical protein
MFRFRFRQVKNLYDIFDDDEEEIDEKTRKRHIYKHFRSLGKKNDENTAILRKLHKI